MLETVSDKHLHEMERLTKELLRVMYKAKLRDLPLIELLHELESVAEKVRRERFDAVNPGYRGY